MKSQYDIFTNSSDTKSAMDTYNTPPNGIDYDPDLLYGGEAMLRPQQRQRAAVRRDSRDDDMQPAAQPRTRRRATPPIPPQPARRSSAATGSAANVKQTNGSKRRAA